MSHALRHAVLLTASAVLSWWVLLLPQAAPAARPGPPPVPPRELEVALTTFAEAPAEPGEVPEPEEPAPDSHASAATPVPIEDGANGVPEPLSAPVTIPIAAAERAPAPPPSESGSRQAPDDGRAASPAPDDPATEVASAVEDEQPPAPHSAAEPDVSQESAPLRPSTDPELLALAHLELSGEAQHGFQSVLLAAPEDQVEIARAFGEELVLVPFSALDPEATAPHYFRLRADEDDPQVEAVAGAPPLERFRQYRDLFEYEYARLPAPLRDLRRSVLSRSEVFLFAALIPTSEWALVIGRRRAALADAGRDIDDVERIVLAYRRHGDTYDIGVQRIDFTDGTHHVPNPDPGNRLADD